MLPKVHKNLENPPARPIIRGNESITEPASQFVDFYIQPFVENPPSFIQDRTYILNKMKDKKNTGSSFLLTMDVESHYTNIDHDQGLEVPSYYLERRQPQQKASCCVNFTTC